MLCALRPAAAVLSFLLLTIELCASLLKPLLVQSYFWLFNTFQRLCFKVIKDFKGFDSKWECPPSWTMLRDLCVERSDPWHLAQTRSSNCQILAQLDPELVNHLSTNTNGKKKYVY